MVCERCGEHFEPGDGVCPRCSQSERAVSDGCVHCRGPEPLLCEGYCVHCGREVRPARAGLPGAAASAAGAQDCRSDGIRSGLAYGEMLAVAWFLIWRGSIVAALIGFITGMLLWTPAWKGGAAIDSLEAALSILPALLLAVLVVMPWLVRMMVKKRFRGFSLVVVREHREW